jgi:hypothetical protein
VTLISTALLSVLIHACAECRSSPSQLCTCARPGSSPLLFLSLILITTPFRSWRASLFSSSSQIPALSPQLVHTSPCQPYLSLPIHSKLHPSPWPSASSSPHALLARARPCVSSAIALRPGLPGASSSSPPIQDQAAPCFVSFTPLIFGIARSLKPVAALADRPSSLHGGAPPSSSSPWTLSYAHRLCYLPLTRPPPTIAVSLPIRCSSSHSQ